MAYSYGAPPGAYGAPRGPPQPPPGMPQFDMSAPVIRLGTAGPHGGGDSGGRPPRGGLGSNSEPLGGGRNLERDRAAVRESMMALQPPTREEVARTIFVGGLGEGTPGDEAIESILRCAGKLRRWTRARDADDHKCKFGFAEYEDVDSLEAAAAIFAGGVEVPVVRNGSVVKNEDGEPTNMRVLIVVDEQSKNYIDEWKSRRKEDPDARQFRIDSCTEDLRQCLVSITNTSADHATGPDHDGDTVMANGTDAKREGAEVVTIPVTLEDELSDIPAEQRAVVAAEIRAFRDRSNRRDLERLRREEELEQSERSRPAHASRIGRGASPAPNGTPSGPNGVPVGPRGNQVAGAPAGPKGYRGVQLPSDYANGVSFVGAINQTEEDAEESDDELERRRQAKKDEELQRKYLDAERRWQNRERTRAMAQQRERERDEAEKSKLEREKDVIAKRLRSWNDDEEARLGREEYYFDRSSWIRKRTAYREREERDDKRDREQEEREKADEKRRRGETHGPADQAQQQTGAEKEPKPQQLGDVSGGFKISLGSAAARTKAAAAQPGPRRAIADVEGLLEDEEDAAASGLKRPELKPLADLSTAPADLEDEEKASARQSLAAEIPTDTESLFAWPIRWNHLSPAIVSRQIRPFVEKKVVEYLGVQEDLLVDAVVDGLQDKKGANEIISELEMALEDEAAVLVKKVWRLAVFWSEAGYRGLT